MVSLPPRKAIHLQPAVGSAKAAAFTTAKWTAFVATPLLIWMAPAHSLGEFALMLVRIPVPVAVIAAIAWLIGFGIALQPAVSFGLKLIEFSPFAVGWMTRRGVRVSGVARILLAPDALEIHLNGMYEPGESPILIPRSALRHYDRATLLAELAELYGDRTTVALAEYPPDV